MSLTPEQGRAWTLGIVLIAGLWVSVGMGDRTDDVLAPDGLADTDLQVETVRVERTEFVAVEQSTRVVQPAGELTHADVRAFWGRDAANPRAREAADPRKRGSSQKPAMRGEDDRWVRGDSLRRRRS